MKQIYKSPLTVYVVWHPSFKPGQKVADYIYANFSRDIETPLSRGIGIPVFYRSVPVNGTLVPKAIPIKESDYNAIVILVDDYMFNDDKWNSYVKQLIIQTDAKNRIFPIAFSSNSYFFEETTLGREQYIDARPIDEEFTTKEFQNKLKVIKSRLLHDLCRLLLNKKALHLAAEEINVPPPVRLFISHAKYDGENQAKEFRDYVGANTKLKTFFDANDIADGYQFDTQIKDAVKDGNAALVVFHSDAYSTREWCQIEILTAKRFKAPIVVVHNIRKGEKRSFPYLGNVPTIRFLNNNFDDIIDLTLFQVLVNVFHKLNLERIIELYAPMGITQFELLSSPPELINFPDLLVIKQQKVKGKNLIVLYPDPPLGNAEVNLLEDMQSNIKFLTPIQLSMLIK